MKKEFAFSFLSISVPKVSQNYRQEIRHAQKIEYSHIQTCPNGGFSIADIIFYPRPAHSTLCYC